MPQRRDQKSLIPEKGHLLFFEISILPKVDNFFRRNTNLKKMTFGKILTFGTFHGTNLVTIINFFGFRQNTGTKKSFIKILGTRKRTILRFFVIPDFQPQR